MNIIKALRNPVVAFADIKKRRELKLALLALMAQRAPGKENGLQFEGVTLENPTPENLTVVLVLREIVSEDRQFSIVNWPGGVSLVNKRDIDALARDFREPNEKTNYIISGGTDKAADLLNNAAKPTGTITPDGVTK